MKDLRRIVEKQFRMDLAKSLIFHRYQIRKTTSNKQLSENQKHLTQFSHMILIIHQSTFGESQF